MVYLFLKVYNQNKIKILGIVSFLVVLLSGYFVLTSLVGFLYNSDDLSQTELDNSVPFKSAEKYIQTYFANSTKKGDVYELTWNGTNNTQRWKETYPVGFTMNRGITVKYGYKVIVSFKIKTPIETTVSLDVNASPADSKDLLKGVNTFDNYGRSIGTSADSFVNTIQPNKWTTFTYWFINDNEKNTKKVAIEDFSVFGIAGYSANKLNNAPFYMKDIQYKVVKVK